MRKAVGMAHALKNHDGSFSPVAIEVDRKLFRIFLSKAYEHGDAFILEMKQVVKSRTFKQQNTIFGLAGILYQCLNDRSPSGEEKEALVRDVMAQYGDYVEIEYKSRANNGAPKTRLLSVSELDILGASKVIQGFLQELAYFDLNVDQQGSVKKIFIDWMNWRGAQKIDLIDSAMGYVSGKTSEDIFREKNTICMACTRGGEGLQIAHIVGRGANGRVMNEPWNWLLLCNKDHVSFQHQAGWDEFLKAYPHLRGRVERAREMASETDRVE